jgi:hypothetical protein
MITPDEVLKRAKRKYRDVLRTWLAGNAFIPIEYPVGSLSKNLTERRSQIELLREQSKAARGTGYSLEWVTIEKREMGKQTSPRRVTIETLDDYLALVSQQAAFDHFVDDVHVIRQHFPALESWMRKYPQLILEHHGKWNDLLTVCSFFVQHPRPNVYIRELPIPIHTKFIEANTRILRDLLDELLPPDSIDLEAAEFSKRFGLKDKSPLVRVRLLDGQLDQQYGVKLDDMLLPVGQLAHLLADHVQPETVIIVENLTNFLTLPLFPNSIGLFGGGFAVHLLRDVGWLNQCSIVYWGDIDAHGFQILSDLRGLFLHTQSVMMDWDTLQDNIDYAVVGNTLRSEQYDYLTEAETAVARHVAKQNVRLEQEHIPHAYAVPRLSQIYRNQP